MDPKQRQFSIWYMFIALWVLMLIQMFLPSFFNPTEIPYSEFKESVAAGSVTEISVSPHVIHGKMKDDKNFNTIRIEDPDLVQGFGPAPSQGDGGHREHHYPGSAVVDRPDRSLLRRLVVPPAPHGAKPGLHDSRSEQSQDLHGKGVKVTLRRCGRSRRGEARIEEDHRISQDA